MIELEFFLLVNILKINLIKGRIYYYHDQNEPTGITSIKFNVTDSESNVLANQRFVISVRGS